MVDLRDLFQGLGDLGFRTLGPHASESCVQAFFACRRGKVPSAEERQGQEPPLGFLQLGTSFM